jgi:hypothetical protein
MDNLRLPERSENLLSVHISQCEAHPPDREFIMITEGGNHSFHPAQFRSNKCSNLS